MADKKWKFREDMLGHYVNGVSNLTFQDAENRLNYLESTLEDKDSKFINPCKLYARIKEDKVVSINGFKLELDMITLFYGNATTGYVEESYMLYDVEIFEQ